MIEYNKTVDRAVKRKIKYLKSFDFGGNMSSLKTENKEVSPKVIEICAEICAHYSEAKGGGKIEVDYTYKRFVKKNANGNLGSVFYTDQKTILVSSSEHKELQIF